MNKKLQEQKIALETKIDTLEKELSKAKKELIPLQAEDIQTWFESVKGKAFYYKWDSNQPEFDGIFRVEAIDNSELYSLDWMRLKGTMITLYGNNGNVDSVMLNHTLMKNQFNTKDEVKLSIFKKLSHKFIKKLEKSI